MKIIINRATANAATATVGGIVEMLTGLRLGDPEAPGHVPTFRSKHHSLTLRDAESVNDIEYVYEIDDVVLVKIMSIYVKFARLLVPVVKAVTTLCEALAPTLERDVAEVVDMLDAPVPKTKVAMH